jgi:hypothetical protein
MLSVLAQASRAVPAKGGFLPAFLKRAKRHCFASPDFSGFALSVIY